MHNCLGLVPESLQLPSQLLPLPHDGIQLCPEPEPINLDLLIELPILLGVDRSYAHLRRHTLDLAAPRLHLRQFLGLLPELRLQTRNYVVLFEHLLHVFLDRAFH